MKYTYGWSWQWNRISTAIKLVQKDYETIYIIGKDAPIPEELPIDDQQALLDKMKFIYVDFVNESFSFLNDFEWVQTLIITTGFERVAKFEALTETELGNGIRVNAMAGNMRCIRL